ncbi:MAG: OmpA family protein [Spirochaetes bacterium]|nr:OmpA family protein [Spirochaetota bacterium]
MRKAVFIVSMAVVLFAAVLPARSDLFYTQSEYNRIYNRKVAAELEIESLRRQFQNEKTNMESKIRDLQGVIEGLNQQLEVLKNQMSEQRDAAAKRIEDLEKRTDILKKRGSDREKELIEANRNLQKECEEGRSELQKKLDREREEHLLAMKKQREDCQTSINDLHGTIANLNGQLSELKDLNTKQRGELGRMKSQADELAEQLKEEIQKGEIRLRKYHDKLIINLDDRICYDSGSAELKRDILPALNKIIKIIEKYAENRIVVEGHTDNVPIASSRFRNNWQLSTERALSVLAYILKNNRLDPRRFSAAGYGEFNPIVQNNTPENRALNRRVDIVVLPKVKE